MNNWLTKGSFHDLVKAFDINKDGSISKEELLAGVEKYFIGKTPETVPGM
jgi:Ca2+-binding EF-hand superfamily protein